MDLCETRTSPHDADYEVIVQVTKPLLDSTCLRRTMHLCAEHLPSPEELLFLLGVDWQDRWTNAQIQVWGTDDAPPATRWENWS